MGLANRQRQSALHRNSTNRHDAVLSDHYRNLQILITAGCRDDSCTNSLRSHYTCAGVYGSNPCITRRIGNIPCRIERNLVCFHCCCLTRLQLQRRCIGTKSARSFRRLYFVKIKPQRHVLIAFLHGSRVKLFFRQRF